MNVAYAFDNVYSELTAESRLNAIIARVRTFSERRRRLLAKRVYSRLRGNGEGCEFGLDWRTMMLIKPLTTRVYKAICEVEQY